MTSLKAEQRNWECFKSELLFRNWQALRRLRQGAARSEEGHHGGRRLDPHRRLPHAQGGKNVSEPWPQSLPTPQQGPAETSSRQTLSRPWLRCGPDPASRLASPRGEDQIRLAGCRAARFVSF